MTAFYDHLGVGIKSTWVAPTSSFWEPRKLVTNQVSDLTRTIPEAQEAGEEVGSIVFGTTEWVR